MRLYLVFFLKLLFTDWAFEHTLNTVPGACLKCEKGKVFVLDLNGAFVNHLVDVNS